VAPNVSYDLTTLGWDDQLATAFTAHSDTCMPGRVSRVDRGAVDVLTGGGAVRAAVRHDTDLPVGDWVAVNGDPPHVVDVLPRRSAFVRGSVSGTSRLQALAANIDTVFVAVPMMKASRVGLIERFVALGWESGATPVVVLTKADLVDDPELVRAQTAAVTPGADVHAVSVVTGDGLDLLGAYAAPGRTVALLGQSGVGKSSLVNALTGVDVMATGAIRSDGKGRHTTTHRELIRLDNGALLIDTPGMRELQLWNADEGLESAFADVEAVAEWCRFRDCAHNREPGCAVRAAVETGTLAPDRLEHWHRLKRELAYLDRKQDELATAQLRARVKAINRNLRDYLRRKYGET